MKDEGFLRRWKIIKMYMELITATKEENMRTQTKTH